jgi:hypothetical protein
LEKACFDYTVAINRIIKEEKNATRRQTRALWIQRCQGVPRRLASDDYAGSRIKDRCLDGTDA